MNLYSIEVKISATAYILAASEEEAQAKAAKLDREIIEFSDRRELIGDGIYLTGERYSPSMPEISLSPAMTIHGASEGQRVDLVEEFEDA